MSESEETQSGGEAADIDEVIEGQFELNKGKVVRSEMDSPSTPGLK